MMRLVATVDLSRAPEDEISYDVDRHDRIALDALDRLPNGAAVIVNVGRRYLVTESARVCLTRNEARLQIQLEGDADMLRRWHDFLTDQGAA